MRRAIAGTTGSQAGQTSYLRLDGALRWTKEASDWGVDPDSGARVIRLTSAPAWSHNIYGEQPFGSPDGRRFLVVRAYDPLAGRQLFVADLETLCLTLAEPDLPTEAVAHSAWSEWVYYAMRDGSLRRLSLMTLERQLVLPPGSVPVSGFESITPDDRWLIFSVPDETRESRAHGDFVRLKCLAFDLRTGQQHVLNDSPENRNPHAQVELGGGGRWLYQLYRRRGTATGLPVFVQPLAGGAPVQLPIGAPWSAESTGHMAWVGTSDRVAVVVNCDRAARRHDPRHPQGNLLLATPGDPKPTVFPAPQCAFYHVSTSRCGRYFVGDDFMEFRADAFGRGVGPLRIVVGNLESGRCRALIGDCQNHGIAGSSRYEPDPYFTADNRYVIYNASPFGLMQVFAAEVPEAFWRSLD